MSCFRTSTTWGNFEAIFKWYNVCVCNSNECLSNNSLDVMWFVIRCEHVLCFGTISIIFVKCYFLIEMFAIEICLLWDTLLNEVLQMLVTLCRMFMFPFTQSYWVKSPPSSHPSGHIEIFFHICSLDISFIFISSIYCSFTSGDLKCMTMILFWRTHP